MIIPRDWFHHCSLNDDQEPVADLKKMNWEKDYASSILVSWGHLLYYAPIHNKDIQVSGN
jgi:hypothetical protein